MTDHAPTPHSGSTTLAPRRGVTLVELVLGLGIMSVLFIGMSSAILVTTKALPATNSITQWQKQTSSALDQFNADLACATAITELTSTAITFTVADRGHGAAGPETIRYAWSGTAGDPLTRQYNAAAPTTIATGVTDFRLIPGIIPGVLTSPPKVLMIVNNTGSLTAEDTARQAKLGSWSFPVALIDSSASQAEFDAAYALADVLYIPDDAFSFTLSSRIRNPSVGIVCEGIYYYSAAGISSSGQTDDDKQINLIDLTHEITKGLAETMPQVLKTNATPTLHSPNGTQAPGARVLAETNASKNPTLVVIEVGGTLHTNIAARSRRVAMPWGGKLFNLFDFTDLSAEGRTLLKRSLVWAAAPPVYDRVRGAKLTVGSATVAEATVELLNQPRVPRP